MHCHTFNSILGFHPLDASSSPQDGQPKCLQTLLSAPKERHSLYILHNDRSNMPSLLCHGHRIYKEEKDKATVFMDSKVEKADVEMAY